MYMTFKSIYNKYALYFFPVFSYTIFVKILQLFKTDFIIYIVAIIYSKSNIIFQIVFPKSLLKILFSI